MRMQNWMTFAAALCGCVIATGCASTPTQKAQKYATAASVLEAEDVKDKPPTIYQHPIAEVRVAASRALAFVGCKVNTQGDFYIAGERPRKWGLFVGSGGETVEVFLYPQSPNETHVWVDTDLTFVGMAGQQGWDDQVLEEMTNILNKQQSNAQ